ncbi:MAG: penicillin-binding protein 2, partial [Desulfuromonadales bacterium GWD2_61_12]
MGLNSPAAAAVLLRRRFLFLTILAVAVFLVLLGRLWYLQVIRAEDYQALSERNRVRYVPIEPPRGPVFDRHGELLVENRPAFGVSVLRNEVSFPEPLLQRLSTLLGISLEELKRRWEAGRRLPRYQPLPLATDIGRDAMEQIQENSLALPGVLIEVQPVRSYTHGAMAAHTFGYVGEISEKDLAGGKFEGYRSGDTVGKIGLEKHLEPYLRGTSGERRVEVDARGRELRQLKALEPVPGKKIYLTLDTALQEVAEGAFGDKAGAAVVLDVNSGEVLALVSRPGFDPALFSGGISVQRWSELVKNPLRPLQNRAIQGQYPPGSTFKIVTALAALQAGAASSGTTVDCSGSFAYGDREFRCWKKEGHGKTDLRKALRESCDVWFYEVALDLGIDRLAQMAFDLGLGQTNELPLDGERKGLIPTREWKRRNYGTSWYNGETVIAAIGQGYVLTTPLQLAVMTAAVANGGTVLRPQLLLRVEDLDGATLYEGKPEVKRILDFAPGVLPPVRRGLEAVVNDYGGTGAAARIDGIRVAGKTGTAQVIKRKEDNAVVIDDPYRFRDHALFVAYAPAERPQIAVAVVVDHGGHGGSSAAPIARAIMNQYFGLAPPLTQPVAEAPAAG